MRPLTQYLGEEGEFQQSPLADFAIGGIYGFQNAPYDLGSFDPSFDFSLFQLPNFGELYADSFGVSSRFNSNYPTPYVDQSLNRLLSLVQPQPYPQGLFAFQDPSGGRLLNPTFPQSPNELQRRTERAIKEALDREQKESEYITLDDPTITWKDIWGLGRKVKMCNDCTPEQEKEMKEGGVKTETDKLFGIPGLKISKEMGYLFIGFIILILLLLFVRK